MSETRTRNIKMVVAYNGARYHGWQRQAEGIDTIQQRLEEAASKVLGHPVTINGAGRTDTGVHAEGQVANVRTPNASVPLSGLRRAINSRLPGDIVVRSAEVAPEAFHPSISAVGKTYRYRIHVAPVRSVWRSGLVYHFFRSLALEPMRRAGRMLVGTRDFRALASAGEQRASTVRTIRRCEVVQAGPEIHLNVQGDGFLYHMVRNIVGTLVEIGRGRWAPQRVERILASRDRRQAGPTAPPDGLYLLCVHYRAEELGRGLG